MEDQAAFLWERQPKAEKLLLELLHNFSEKSQFIRNLDQSLHSGSSTRLFDWLDHFSLEATEANEEKLQVAGFTKEEENSNYTLFTHQGAQLPSVVMFHNNKNLMPGLAFKTDSISDFLMTHQITSPIEGSPFSGYRKSLVSEENQVHAWAIERRGTRTMEPTFLSHDHPQNYLEAFEELKLRPRSLEDENEALRLSIKQTEQLVKAFGKDMAAWLFLEGERYYWQNRNGAAQIQKNRQDRLGMGWANHDHHTFRSSRQHFPQLVTLFETIGFHCRERFYAGEEAGWGAQVMENSNCGLILFLDLDLSPEEVAIDFSHQALPQLDQLGTIGLWCALHGESILQAGMHHLECQFIYNKLQEDLNKIGIEMMDPFSNFSYLKQGFTKGEVWQVNPKRAEKLFQENKITSQDKERFLKEGAIGSHLENLERNEGFKGFNQKNVSWIIKKTDPRKQEVS